MRFFISKLIQTEADNWPALILRFTLGVVIFPHGAQKLLGWFGGHGIQATMDMWHQWWGLPSFVTLLVILAESFGAIALIMGFLGHFMAASIGLVMFGAVYLLHWNQGFFMNWYGEANKLEGFEFHLLVFGMVIALMILGSGKWSLDGYLQKVVSESQPNEGNYA